MLVMVTGYITENGELELTLPEGLPPGKVEISIRVGGSDEDESEFEPLPIFEAKTGAEIVAELEATDGWWHDDSITDGQTWVEEKRRQRAERRQLPKW